MLKAGQNMMKYCEKDTKTTQNVFVMVQRLMNLITIFFYKVWSVLDLKNCQCVLVLICYTAQKGE